MAVVLVAGAIGVVFWKQDYIVQQFITTANADFTGLLEVEGSHISPFANFPYISIDLDHVRVYENKAKDNEPLLDVRDAYLGFDLWTILRGKMEIKSVKLAYGMLHVVQHADGSINIANALSNKKEVTDASEEFHLDIQRIQLDHVDLTKVNEASGLLLETFINDATARFATSPAHVLVSLDSRFLLNVVMGADTTFIKHKHFDVNVKIDFDTQRQQLTLSPSQIQLERAEFNVDGSIDFANDADLNINVHGSKPNFDLFLAFAPEELAPVLDRYDNGGKIFFEATVKGKSTNGHTPRVNVDFGCEDAFINNRVSNKKLDQLFFKGNFNTGDKGELSTMAFSLQDFSARPEAGIFSGSLQVKNFESPDIALKLRSQFELGFLAQFFNITNLRDLSGKVALTMNFHDIVDLTRPERSIEKLNESYFTELEVENLSFTSPDFHLPLHHMDIKAHMDGHHAFIDHFRVQVGNSDVTISGDITDLPAILHHTVDPVRAQLKIASNFLDVRQLTSGDTFKAKPVDEQISNLNMKFTFISSARAFTESPNLPVGEFFIDSLYARLSHYPHTLHDFHADVFVDSLDFRVVDFTGMIDKSDFHFSGRLKNYDLWFLTEPLGDTRVEFDLTSNLLQLHDMFAYGGENFVPQDYRHEEFRNLKVHGLADLHFKNGLKSVDVLMDKLEAQMKIHPMRFEKFRGRVHYEDQHLQVQNAEGKVGRTQFLLNLNYYLGSDSIVRKRDNHLSLVAPRLDFDELFAYQPPPATAATPATHESGFNIYDVPFSDMTFHFDIKHLNYHRYLIDDFFMRARTTRNHYIHVDTLSLAAAGGQLHGKGYFNGSDRNRIYFSPDIHIRKMDLDKLLFKFENFGQDHLVSENLHGQLSGRVRGKAHVHPDLVPIVDDSQLQLDLEVLNGRLDNYGVLMAMSDFFGNKDLSRVRFDTLSNHLDLDKGTLSVPAMTINSTLGFIEVSGRQDLNLNMEYYVRVPWRLVTQVARQKLFPPKADGSANDDEIQYRDETKRVRFVNLKIAGTPDAYKISLERDKGKDTP